MRPVRLRDLEGSALCLSYDKRRLNLYVQRNGDRLTGIFLNGEYAFHAFPVDVSVNWKGLLLPDPSIIADTDSAYDSEASSSPLGALIIDQTGASIVASMRDRSGFADSVPVRLEVDMGKISPGIGVGFHKWSFKIGDGREAQYLSVDVTPDG